MEPAETPARTRPWWALLVVVASLVGAVALIAGVDGTEGADADDAPMLAVSPGGAVELASLPADQQVTYRAAADDPEAFSEVRCYCGCESFLGHEDLAACFVRPDGRWERHATGCAVCLNEAEQVIEDRERDVPIDEIVARIDDRFGGITGDTTT